MLNHVTAKICEIFTEKGISVDRVVRTENQNDGLYGSYQNVIHFKVPYTTFRKPSIKIRVFNKQDIIFYEDFKGTGSYVNICLLTFNSTGDIEEQSSNILDRLFKSLKSSLKSSIFIAADDYQQDLIAQEFFLSVSEDYEEDKKGLTHGR
jgi:Fe2+ transport system protein B